MGGGSLFNYAAAASALRNAQWAEGLESKKSSAR